MGMSVAASSAIIFTGFLIVATVLMSAINATIMDSENNFKLAQNKQIDQSHTNLRFDNATKNATTLFVNVTNTGSTVLSVKNLQVLVNGTLVTDMVQKHNVSGIATTTIWGPGEKLYLELTLKPKIGQRVKVLAETGIGASGTIT